MRYLSFTAAAIAAVLAAGAASAQQINARLGHCASEADSIHQSAVLTKAAFERMSNGRLTLSIFGGCQLGSVGAMISQIQLGTLDMFPIPPAFAVGASRNFSVPSIRACTTISSTRRGRCNIPRSATGSSMSARKRA